MFSRFMGILLMGFIIKIMDDYLDKDIDKLCNQQNLSIIMGRYLVPYSFLLTIFALYFNFKEAAALFAVSYFIGMIHTYRGLLPTRIKGWQEGIIIFVLFSLILSIQEMVFSLIIVLIIQLVDDIVDYRRERFLNSNNVVNYIGFPNSIFAVVILTLISLLFFPIKFLYYIIAASVLYLTIFLIENIRTDIDDY